MQSPPVSLVFSRTAKKEQEEGQGHGVRCRACLEERRRGMFLPILRVLPVPPRTLGSTSGGPPE
jgi:hypothetical protein